MVFKCNYTNKTKIKDVFYNLNIVNYKNQKMNYISVPLNFLPELVIFESELNNMIHQFETIIGNKIRDLFQSYPN